MFAYVTGVKVIKQLMPTCVPPLLPVSLQPAEVLLIEDDAAIATALAEKLQAAGFNVTITNDGKEGLGAVFSSAPFDVIVLDRRLPSLDGLSILRQLRARGVLTPVLMLTALDRVSERVEGLKGGADDYLVKPFAFDELEARLIALVRRDRPSQANTVIRVGELTIDVVQRAVWRDKLPITLQPREFRLLEVLARHAGSLVSRKMLLEQVWNYHFDPQTKVVETHVSRLRSKLNENGRPDLIETVRNVGYRVLAT